MILIAFLLHDWGSYFSGPVTILADRSSGTIVVLLWVTRFCSQSVSASFRVKTAVSDLVVPNGPSVDRKVTNCTLVQ